MQRTPRDKDEAHLKFIRTLPCCVCGDDTTTEAAHVRMADRSIAKPMSGMQTKCDDRFAVPLCGGHHREQHAESEHQWWLNLGVDPIKVALALYSVSGNYERGWLIVTASRERAAA
jgi:hypothetical protein